MRQITPDLTKPQYKKKMQQVSELEDKLGRSTASVVIEYRGMTVKETTELRSRLRKVNAELEISKNTLVKRATEGKPTAELNSLMEGPNAMVFAFEDSVAAVKALADYARENKLLILKGGLVEGRLYGAERLQDIAKMPPREQIYAQLLGALQAPAANLVGMLQAPMAQLVFTLQAVAERDQAAA